MQKHLRTPMQKHLRTPTNPATRARLEKNLTHSVMDDLLLACRAAEELLSGLEARGQPYPERYILRAAIARAEAIQ